MTKEELIKEYGYWGEHPSYPWHQWSYDVGEDYTRSGYWDWVLEQAEEAQQ